MNREEIKDLIVSVIVNPENLTEVIDKICLYIPLDKGTLESDANPEEGEPQLEVGDYVYTNNPWANYITTGKRYTVRSLGFKSFKITDDDEDPIWCVKKNCEFGGDWIIDKK